MSQRNENFAKAIDWLYEKGKVADQKELSLATGINAATISRILNNKVKEPSEETLRKLNSTFGGVFNMDYFRGKSEEMLAKDEPKETCASTCQTDQSSILAAKDDAIISLKRELDRADRQIAGLLKQIDDKDDIIALLKDKIANLERLVAKSQAVDMPGKINDMQHYPFPIGLTDDGSVEINENLFK